jgi:hypothetical protein
MTAAQSIRYGLFHFLLASNQASANRINRACFSEFNSFKWMTKAFGASSFYFNKNYYTIG